MENPPPSPLSADTHSRIDALAKRISLAHYLDEDLHAELRAHIEDKLTAYLAGEEKITEPDALLLAQAHFGDPKTIQSLFTAACPKRPANSRRRLLTLSTAGAALLIIALFTPPLFDWLQSRPNSAPLPPNIYFGDAPTIILPGIPAPPKHFFNGRPYYLGPLCSTSRNSL